MAVAPHLDRLSIVVPGLQELLLVHLDSGDVGSG